MSNVMIFKILVFTFIQSQSSAPVVHAEDWPCWRGSNGDGISRETNWNPNSLRDGAKILWNTNVGQGHSAVSIKNGFLYTQGSRIFEKDGKEIYEESVYCLNALTGEEIWHYHYPTAPMAQTGPRATPTVDGHRVFTLGAKGHLFCFHAQTGEVFWKRDLVSEKLSSDSKWGFSGSPVVEGDRLILNVGSAGLVFDKSTGDIIWRSGFYSWGLATPVLTEIQDRKIALLNTEHTLYAVNISDGNVVWTYPWSYCDADPVLVQDKIYLFGGKPGKKRCRTLIRISDGKQDQIWPERKMNVAFQSWIAYNGCVYGITWDKRKHHFQCFNPQSGKVEWQRRLDDWTAFTIANESIILIEADGDLVIIQASPDNYKEISRAKVLNMKRRDDFPDDQPLTCWTAPVLFNGKIVVRNTYGEMACIDVSR